MFFFRKGGGTILPPESTSHKYVTKVGLFRSVDRQLSRSDLITAEPHDHEVGKACLNDGQRGVPAGGCIDSHRRGWVAGRLHVTRRATTAWEGEGAGGGAGGGFPVTAH